MKRKQTSKAKSRRVAEAASAPTGSASNGSAKNGSSGGTGWAGHNPTDMFNPMKAMQNLAEQMRNSGMGNMGAMKGMPGMPNMGSATRYGKTIAEGYQSMGQELAAFTQSSLEKQMSNATALMTCKSVTEALAKQSEMAKSAYDDLVQAYTRLSEMSMKIAQTAMSEMPGTGKK